MFNTVKVKAADNPSKDQSALNNGEASQDNVSFPPAHGCQAWQTSTYPASVFSVTHWSDTQSRGGITDRRITNVTQ